MLEPLPRKVQAPALEPSIRVGIVLSEDRQTSLRFRCDAALKLNPDPSVPVREGTVQVCSTGKVTLKVSGQSLAVDTLTVEYVSSAPTEHPAGITLENVLVGRSFHWRKSVALSFLGRLEFSVENGFLKVVNELPFEDYLSCVITSEMGPDCPLEFMKAQLIAARSWAYVFLHGKHPDSGFDVCNDDDCQRYQGTTFLNERALKASKATRGEFLTFSPKDGAEYVAPSYYIKTCGGITEEPSEIFGFKEASLCSVVDSPTHMSSSLDPEELIELSNERHADFYCGRTAPQDSNKYLGKVDEGGTHFRWTRKSTQDELIEGISKHCQISGVQEILNLRVSHRTISGRITELEIEYRTDSGDEALLPLKSQYQIRQVLSPSFLPSSAFLFHKDSENSFHFQGAGWGHGVGLCQVGGVMMALAGKTYSEILEHYFPFCELHKGY